MYIYIFNIEKKTSIHQIKENGLDFNAFYFISFEVHVYHWQFGGNEMFVATLPLLFP